MKECLERGIDMISSMGAANKTDPTRFEIADISKTHTDPIAKVIRNRLKRQGIRKGVKVVFSDESPIVIREDVKETVGDKMRLIVKVKCHLHLTPLYQVW